jgi:hypothetical protein
MSSFFERLICGHFVQSCLHEGSVRFSCVSSQDVLQNVYSLVTL